ncbi:thioredoxin domain-containing protein [Neomoorella thermoacetica]|uniref:thioredoxin domain-containing protein n=1 Tax=Neomoorella thermoacetica TaxID=1525 RepID=UPI0030CF3CF0
MPDLRRPNRLIHEKSPYLLQHAYNPVDWYPWGEEAFARARREDKPVFLSIGYSTCHWCHVMARESFNDEEVAALLNDSFIAIKVDREERPDIDQVYMAACQALTGSGGWPLTVFLTPEKRPFYAGTYFPKHSRYGRPGLVELLKLIREKWATHREELEESGAELIQHVARQFTPTPPGEPGAQVLEKGWQQLRAGFDPLYGGFSEAPKFPSPHQLLFLLRYWKRYDEAGALAMVEKTLQAMYCGGIYDHIGFGFARYSTDRRWLVPHFEKMLYDNALLAMAYLETRQATGKAVYGHVAREIFTWVLRDMTTPEGGFYSALDADSEGEEGRFYLWTPDQVREVLGGKEGEFFCRYFDITAGGNFEGRSIPNLIGRGKALFAAGTSGNESNDTTGDQRHPREQGGRAGGISGGGGCAKGSPEDDRLPGRGPTTLAGFGPATAARLAAAREKLFAAREKRVHPHRDDKILTAWNGLMIAALARGAWVLDEPAYAAAAARAARFILTHLRDAEGRLQARYREGQAAFPAYLDDYAFLTWGLIELYQATFETGYLREALALTRQMQELFRDEGGGYFFTPHGAGELPVRPREVYDGAIPSGNSVAALNLLRLARITGDSRLEEEAAAQVRALAGTVAEYPRGYSFYLCALDFYLGPVTEIVLAGERETEDTRALLRVLRAAYLPSAVLVLRPGGREGEEVTRLIPYTADQKPVNGKATIYLCRNFACRAPVTTAGELEQWLASAGREAHGAGDTINE